MSDSQQTRTTIVPRQVLAFQRGAAAFRAGRTVENRRMDAEWKAQFGELADDQWEWLGFMVERGMEIMKATRVREWAEEGGLLP